MLIPVSTSSPSCQPALREENTTAAEERINILITGHTHQQPLSASFCLLALVCCFVLVASLLFQAEDESVLMGSYKRGRRGSVGHRNAEV